jgi:2-keto-4-pentenoate hydratase/2-oxohepta-3-ene-1,7-dioic acid hydratase in catechol pathway
VPHWHTESGSCHDTIPAMKLVSYGAGGTLKPGIVLDGDVHDVAQLLPDAPASVRGLIGAHGDDLAGLASALEDAAAGGDARVGEVQLGPPVPDPAKVLCVGINYRDHAAETGRALPQHPDIFSKFASSLVGPDEDLAVSDVSAKLDYEGELAIVIGRPCRNVAAVDAIDHVAGAMVLNDLTARDLQFNATQWLPGKAVDGSTPCGPALVTLDEVGDLQELELVTRVNGAEVQRSNTRRMIFPVAEVVAYVSQFLALAPGDVITTGTPDGVGSRMDPPSFLSAGDVVEVEIDRLGALRNTVR